MNAYTSRPYAPYKPNLGVMSNFISAIDILQIVYYRHEFDSQAEHQRSMYTSLQEKGLTCKHYAS